MSIFTSWAVFPALWVALALGCGLALEACCGRELPGALLLPLGLAIEIVIGGLTTASGRVAPVTPILVVVVALAGFAVAPPWRRRWHLAAPLAAVAVFAIYAAPVVLSGRATFAGYIALDDTATWLAFTDRVLDHGRDASHLAPSSYAAIVQFLQRTQYPTGANIPLGVGGELTGVDIAWLFQPYLALLAATTALALYALAATVVSSRRLAAVVAVLAAQPPLLYSFGMWGGMKELAATGLIPAVAALLVPELLRERAPRRLLPLAVVSAALLTVLSYGGAVWLIGAAAVAATALLRSRGALRLALLGGGVVVLSLPALWSSRTFLDPNGGGGASGPQGDLGNLFRPLKVVQAAGVWLAADFRLGTRHGTLVHVLAILIALAAAAALAVAIRRRSLPLLAYAGMVLAGAAVLLWRGSPWIDAKTLATASPLLLLGAGLAAALVYSAGRRPEAAALFVVLVAGVAWSNWLTYRNVALAPRDQLHELEQIGRSFEDRRPAFMLEQQIYGVRHFLRALDPESPVHYRNRVIPLTDGSPPANLGAYDIDDFRSDGILVYDALVLRRSPAASRPPSVYELAWQGRYYEVWLRRQSAASLLRRLPLGGWPQAVAVPSCSDVEDMARLAQQQGARLATVSRQAALVVPVSGTAETLLGLPPSRMAASVTVPAGGTYRFWLQGSSRREIRLEVDGMRAGGAVAQRNWYRNFIDLGGVELTAGRHRVLLVRSGQGLLPGQAGGDASGIGPLVVATQTADLPVETLAPARWRELCGRSLDWIEAVRPG